MKECSLEVEKLFSHLVKNSEMLISEFSQAGL